MAHPMDSRYLKKTFEIFLTNSEFFLTLNHKVLLHFCQSVGVYLEIYNKGFLGCRLAEDRGLLLGFGALLGIIIVGA